MSTNLELAIQVTSTIAKQADRALDATFEDRAREELTQIQHQAERLAEAIEKLSPEAQTAYSHANP